MSPFAGDTAGQRGLLSDAQLREHARDLAVRYKPIAAAGQDGLLARLAEDESALDRAFMSTRVAAAEERTIEPAAEWLIDNFYVIKEQIKEIRAGLPKSYRRELPVIELEPGRRLPRVVMLMRELVAHADGKIRKGRVGQFVDAYQEIECLTLGELWAIPLMLRFALIEQMAPLAGSMLRRLRDTAAAADWAEHLLRVVNSTPGDLVLVIADMARARAELTPAWVSEFHRRLQGGGSELSLALVWLEQQLTARHLTIADALDLESAAQAAAQVSTSNCIGSLRQVGRADWTQIVEGLSVVESALRDDPAGVYAAMDFTTRDRYRHAVETLARRSRISEWEVARRVVARAAEEPDLGDTRAQHVGYWLVDRGRAEFERELGAHRPLQERASRQLLRHPSLLYIGLIVLLTLAIATLGLPGIEDFGRVHAVLIIAALVVAATHVSVAIVNWLITLRVAPKMLCRLELKGGIPDPLRTLVAIPCLLNSEAGVRELVAALEIRYLANRDPNLYFSLLSDFTDAPSASMQDDVTLLAAARAGIEALNRSYDGESPPRFCLFHRDREWNPGEQVWMGRERKRGKLSELNRFLRGRAAPGFHLLIGDPAILRGVKYVITLDADTELPPQSALKLVATMAHPLNQPRIDRRLRRVVEGYGVLQPRVSVGASRESASALARLYSDEIGLDPYTRLVSDVYQDLFAEASFVGKGIYDVDAFGWATGTRFPDNLILSHDLLEGSYARTGLVSDVELFEHHPDRYSTDMRRRHRWLRGDWQIWYWLLPWVPGPRRRRLRNTLHSHHRWKLLDNLRRSLVPAALLVLLLNGWLLSMRPLYWTVLVLVVIFVSPVMISLDHLLNRNPRMDWGLHFQLTMEAGTRRLRQTALQGVMLPYEACHHLDAALRSLWRVLVSRRRLLQWMPAHEVARHAARGIASFYRMMWTAPVVAIVVTALLLWRGVPMTWIAAPLLMLWLGSPLLAWAISQPQARPVEGQLDAAQRVFLGALARRTWHFFDTFVDARNNALPPDNYQEFPSEQTAHRTSPTNIGMYLVSALSAWDFGYLTTPELTDRIAATLDTLERLERRDGHLLNWYDTLTLEPLRPAYVSSVDSGNLLGCLLVLARGLVAMDEDRLLPPQAWRGLRDTWQVYLDHHAAVKPAPPPPRGAASAALTAIGTLLASPPATTSSLRGQAQTLATLAQHARVVADSTADVENVGIEADPWLLAFRQHCAVWSAELAARAPWLALPIPAAAADSIMLARLDQNPSLRRAVILAAAAANALDDTPGHAALRAALDRVPGLVQARGDLAANLAVRCRALCDVDYSLLWVAEQKLLTIGYNLDQHERDAGTYDLLASEARLCSFVGIAQGKLPREHWFALGRLLTIAAGQPVLVSWSGSMFEYLMPLLLMPAFNNTLLTRTCRSVIARQINYGRENGVPWGVSESAYNVTDAHLVYQYRAFGVPGLGFKRGLAEDLVIAPYASAMALLLRPDAAARNLRELVRLGALGRFGLYDAFDYTPARVPAEAAFAIVRNFMAHHQGMILTALSAALNEQPLQRRFLREPMFRANQLLLQEKVPAALLIDATTLRAEESIAPAREVADVARVLTRMDTTVPQVQLLSNGRYHVVVSQAGGGYSQWGELAVSQWAEDGTRDDRGIFCYVQDLDRDLTWSNTWQPTRAPASDYIATFAQASAEFRRTDHGIETHTRMAVSSEDDVELRRVTVTNRSGTRRRLALTSYIELVTTRRSDAQAHPAFNKLFVETEFIPTNESILARRRARAADERPPVFLHLMAAHDVGWSSATYETRREPFLGRGRSVAAPLALEAGTPLANGAGAVLDPIAALRREIVLEPGQSAALDIVIGAAATRELALNLAERYAGRYLGTRVFELAWTRVQVVRHQLNLSADELKLFTRMASSVLYPNPDLHARSATALVPAVGQSGLWKYGISGDLPIVLVRVGNLGELPLVRQALQAHVFWHMHGLQVDLVIWNEDASGYRQELQDRIMGLISSSAEAPALDRPGGVFVRRSEHITQDDRVLLLATARIVLNGSHGSMALQLPRRAAARSKLPPPRLFAAPGVERGMAMPADLQLFNGTGGYSADGREYLIWLSPGHTTPLPWANVLANPQFGSVVTESGGAYTWSQNAREFRLTPWYNDPVTDESGEALYIRDDGSGEFWSPTPAPARGRGAYLVSHGFGYSRYETLQSGIASTLTVFVATELPLKFSLLRVRNDSAQPRHLSVFAYVEWLLGDQRARSAPHVATTPDGNVQAIYAENRYNDTFGRSIGFLATSSSGASATGNRAEFIGRNRDLHDPAALHFPHLGASFGAGIDPCAAWQAPLILAPGEERELVFVLGIGTDLDDARRLVRDNARLERAAAELANVIEQWRQLLGRVVVHTPDRATDLLVNGWLSYQVIACRLWGRSGYYQSGGAYGFRDQLQDVMALLTFEPALAREQILRAAARQFVEGDVQHWWHPPHGRGVRTHFSDDYLWLPWTVAQYIRISGDRDILDVVVPFLEGRALGADEESYYDFAETSATSASLYEHCARAIRHALRFGEHGLPLIGAGDWNDGMNRVGRLGRGESVWLGFFLVDVLQQFAPLAQARGDLALQQLAIDEAAALAQRIDDNAWDGAWYRRAYTDEGVPLGSAQNDECKIDSLPQSWAALTGVGSMERRNLALDEAIAHLVHTEDQVIQLFEPPFDQTSLDPGYIKGYIPGIRENGGQYTHAAVWLGMAAAELGRCDQAWTLFDVINPINHARDPAAVDTYKVEPYVAAADVYWATGHRGRGGWTWYTGSAGWLYRFALESLLGLHLHAGFLSIRPRVPAHWNGYRIQYRFGATDYDIEVVCQASTHGHASLTLDGVPMDGDGIALIDDGVAHRLRVHAAHCTKRQI